MSRFSFQTNMTRHEIFNIWAPQGVVWSDWVKPVLFACMEERDFSVPPEPGEIPEIIFPLESDMAIVLDLPGSLGVSIGMVAARAGYRPVPLYNALPAPNENLLGMAPITVPSVLNIMRALRDATPELSQLLDRSPRATGLFAGCKPPRWQHSAIARCF